MKVVSPKRVSDSRSGNLKAAPQTKSAPAEANPKLVGLLVITYLLGTAGAAHAQSNFFQGKTVRVIRGGQAGDLYDLSTRHIATNRGKHIPGNPSVMVQNMVEISRAARRGEETRLAGASGGRRAIGGAGQVSHRPAARRDRPVAKTIGGIEWMKTGVMD